MLTKMVRYVRRLNSDYEHDIFVRLSFRMEKCEHYQTDFREAFYFGILLKYINTVNYG